MPELQWKFQREAAVLRRAGVRGRARQRGRPRVVGPLSPWDLAGPEVHQRLWADVVQLAYEDLDRPGYVRQALLWLESTHAEVIFAGLRIDRDAALERARVRAWLTLAG